jgi:hypothetical protein
MRHCLHEATAQHLTEHVAYLHLRIGIYHPLSSPCCTQLLTREFPHISNCWRAVVLHVYSQ